MGREDQQQRDRTGGAGRGLLLALVLVSLVGIFAAAYLSVLHWKVRNQPGHISFCAVSESINCDTVSLSRFSVVAGVPISTWGVLFFLAMVVLGIWGFFRNRAPWPWGLVSVFNACAASLCALLFLLSEFVIRSFCIMCIVLYVVNLTACVLCILGQRKMGVFTPLAMAFFVAALLIGAVGFAVWYPGPAFGSWWFLLAAGLAAVGLVALVWVSRRRGDVRLLENLKHDLAFPFRRPLWGGGLTVLSVGVLVAVLLATPRLYPEQEREIAGGLEGLAHGRTAEGHNWIGAEQPEVVVVEYSDYECPHCRRAHEVVREVVRERKEWLRMVHVHMPLDHACNPALGGQPFHRYSCACARAAICADRQDSFWEMNDALFIRRGGLDAGGLTILAAKLGLDSRSFRSCMKSPGTTRRLRADLALCRRLGLRPATPTFSVDGRVVVGSKPKRWWMDTVEQVREQKSQTGSPEEPGQGDET